MVLHSVFWHQLLRKRLTKSARYICYRILRLPRPRSASSRSVGLFARYTELSLTFVISGLFHQSTEAAQGLKWKESQATRFFSFMALGIILEDMVQWVFYRLGPHEKRGSRLAKALGYIWVLLYFVYATPYYAYPGLSKNTGGTQNEFLPLSILRLLRGR